MKIKELLANAWSVIICFLLLIAVLICGFLTLFTLGFGEALRYPLSFFAILVSLFCIFVYLVNHCIFIGFAGVCVLLFVSLYYVVGCRNMEENC